MDVQKPAWLGNRPNKIIYQKCSDESFYRMWVEFLTPFHRLAMREKDVMAKIISQYFKLKEQCDDPVMLRELLWSQSSRQDMRTSLGMSQPHFQMVLGKLREKNVIKDGDINPRFLPSVKRDNRTFGLLIVFDYSTTGMPEQPSSEAVSTTY